jgi:prepilin-type N-terminal cleavage/methylation domain-containing protein
VAAPLLNCMANLFSVLRSERGFSLTEMMLVVGVMGTLMAMAVPIAQDVTASAKLSESARLVERELQDARLRAVSANRILRVRTNCPSTGFIRTVEVLGTAADTPTSRCSATAYPYPPDQDLMTRPNYDGPLRVIPNSATVPTVDIQFLPDGTAQLVTAGTAARILTEQSIAITRRSVSRTVTVNAAGKVQLQIR